MQIKLIKQIKLKVVLPLTVPQSLQGTVIQLKLGGPVLLGGQEIQPQSVEASCVHSLRTLAGTRRLKKHENIWRPFP